LEIRSSPIAQSEEGAKPPTPSASRRDTHLEAEGAEFLVLGHLLAEGIEAHKMYTNYPISTCSP
jgi:hypothetical protein